MAGFKPIYLELLAAKVSDQWFELSIDRSNGLVYDCTVLFWDTQDPHGFSWIKPLILQQLLAYDTESLL